MAAAVQNIRVAIDTTSDVSAEAAKAATALRGLADTVVAMTKVALQQGDLSIRMNQDIAASYQRTLDTVKAAGAGASASFADALAAARASADGIIASQREEQDAYDKTADAAKLSAAKVDAAADSTVLANKRTSDSAVTGSTREQKAARDAANAYGAKSSAVTKAGNTIALALAGVAAVSVDLGVKFEKAMTVLQTQAGASESQVKKLSKAILEMSPTVGATPVQLADSMYHVVSAMNASIKPTERVSQEMAILKQAAMGAAIGHSNLEQTTYALTSALNALHEPGQKAGQVMSQLNAIVGVGDMRMEELVGALSTGIIPASKSFGISVQSMGAALDTMTQEGMPAQQSATRLRQAIALIGAPTKQSAKELEALGLTQGEITSRSQAVSKALEESGLTMSKLSADLKKPDGIEVALQHLKTGMQEAGLTAEEQSALISRAFGGGRMGTAIESLYQRLPALQQNYNQQLKVTGQYTQDWQKTQETLGFQWDEIKGKAAQVATEIGTALIPDVERFLNEIQSVWKWLDKNQEAAHALELAIGGFAAIAMGSALLSRLKEMAKVFGQITTAPGALERLVAGSGPTSTGTGGVVSSLEGKGMIGGSRSGLGLPGSPSNPIIVAIEAGEYAGLGSLGAKGTVASEAKAAESEAGATEAGVGESVAAGSLISSLRTSLGSVLSSALKGAMIAGIGTIGSQLVGGAVGGKTGKDISKIGTDASFGAGIGMLVGAPIEGAVAGALLGGFETFLHKGAESEGDKVAASVSDAMKKTLAGSLSSSISESVSKGLTDARNAANKKLPNEGHTFHVPAGMDLGKAERERVEGKPATAAQTAQAAIVLHQQEFTAGGKTGQEFAKAMGAQATHLNFGEVYESAQAALAKMPEIFREGAYNSMSSFVAEMEKQQRLPTGSVEAWINAMHEQFPKLGTYSQQAATLSAKAFADGAKNTQALSNTQAFIASLNKEWQGMPATAKLTTADMASVVAQNMTFLESKVQVSTGKTKTDAERNLKELHDHAIALFTDTRVSVIAQASAMGAELATSTSSGKTALLGNFKSMVGGIEAQMKAGLVSVQGGIADINKALDGALEGMGITKAQIKKYVGTKLTTGETVKAIEGAASGSLGKRISESEVPIVGKATGGLVQFGRPGDNGRDTIGLNMGGQNIAVGSGEMGAVLTRHQQSVANNYLSPIGGLPGLFSKVSTPHYMAEGGTITPPTASGTGMVPALAQSTLNLVAAAASRLVGTSGTTNMSALSGFTGGGGTSSSNESLAKKMMEAAGWPGSMWPYLKALWTQESGFRTTAKNPLSGAYGIPQSLPASKMASAGADWMSNPATQIKWGLEYIRSTYGSPAGAEAHEMAHKWYARGGILNAAQGITVEKPQKISVKVTGTKKLAAIAKPKASKISKTKAGKTVNVRSLSHKLAELPELTDASALLPYETKINTLVREGSLLSNIEGMSDGVSILPSDMQYLNPTLEPGESIVPYMNTIAAERVRQATVERVGETEPLDLQGQLIQWISGLDDHRLLSAADVANLSGTFGEGVKLGVNGSVFGGARSVLEAQMADQQGMVSKVETPLKNKAIQMIASRKKKLKTVTKAAEHYAARIKQMKEDVRKLTTGSLKQRLAAAVNSTSIANQKAGAQETIDHYQELIDVEKEAAKPDTATISHLTTRIAQERSYVQKLKAPSTTVQNAYLALQKNELGNQIAALGEDEHALSGSTTTVGKSGTIGELEKQIKTLEGGSSEIGARIAEQLQATIPDLSMEISQITEGLTEAAGSLAPQIIPGSSTQSTILTGLLEQQNLQLSESAKLANAQFSVLKGMIPQIPRYEHGGMVANTGLAMVHQGEWITPNPKGPYGSQVSHGAPTVIELHQHFSGPGGELARMVDHRIESSAAHVVSRQTGQRTRMLQNAPGGRR